MRDVTRHFLMFYLFFIKLIEMVFMQILVVFMESEPITVKSVRALHSQISNNQGLRGMILILQSKMNHFAQKELTTFPFTVETFPVSIIECT